MRFAFSSVATVTAFAFVLFPVNSEAQVALDYDYYKNRVEPVFLARRDGHARCFVCHSDANNAFRLQKLSEKNKAWSEDESRKNFAVASALVTPGNPDTSRLLIYPLAPEAGGSTYHSGGRQFNSKKDPEWLAMAAWVKGAKLAAGPDRK